MKLVEKINQIKGDVYKPKNSLGVKRKDMPQIEDQDQSAFIKWLKEKGVSYKKMKHKIKELKPSQSELSVKAASNLAGSGAKKLDKPLIVSDDLYIIDGHHRWLAKHMEDQDQEADVLHLSMKAKELIDLIKEFPKAAFRDIKNKSV